MTNDNNNADQVLLSVDNLHTYFETDSAPVKAVDGVTFDLYRGETLGVVGESGSGKSIMSMSILGLIPKPPGYHPKGQVLFHHTNILEACDSDLRKIRGNQISMIFQDPMSSLNPYLTIEKQLVEVLIEHRKMGKKEAFLIAVEMLNRVGIADAIKRIKDYPHQFSGGMRQRVMIAMMLLCEPKILIADEPTTALDVTIQAQIIECIKEEQKRLGSAVILITHDLGVVAGVADRILVMYAGRVVEEADTLSLFNNPSHPYTKGLLRSIPRADLDDQHKLETIPGAPPDLSAVPKGCPFHPRCDVAVERCHKERPELVSLTQNKTIAPHRVACWEAV